MNNRVLITGGVGFIGIHSAKYFCDAGSEVCLLDNFSRAGTAINQRWLLETHQPRVEVADVRDYERTCAIVRDFRPDLILHLAGQVAVTSSVNDPRQDFEINTLGTVNILEAMRHYSSESFLIYSSTNKVYGNLESTGITERQGRWEYSDMRFGVSETQPLDFHSPYGCSKGAADQYVLDYSRIYGLRTTVFRQSCIYGTQQFGIEDQGWVAWFSIAAALNKPITIYGDGKQTRDVLHVRDLVGAYAAAAANANIASGQAFNVGGGPQNTLSLHELIIYIEHVLGRSPQISYGDWRPGDQKTFVCDIRKAERLLLWSPRTSVADGVTELIKWAGEYPQLFSHL